MSKSREITDPTDDPRYQQLLQRISDTYVEGQRLAFQAVNEHLTATNWQIGRHIVEFEQGGKAREEYGTGLLQRLSQDLTLRHGKGFTRSGIIRIRQFYLAFPKGATASHLLSWSHFVELLKIDDPLERSFYEQQTISERWTVRELLVEYATYEMNSQLFVQKYQLYLPNREELRRELENTLRRAVELGEGQP